MRVDQRHLPDIRKRSLSIFRSNSSSIVNAFTFEYANISCHGSLIDAGISFALTHIVFRFIHDET